MPRCVAAAARRFVGDLDPKHADLDGDGEITFAEIQANATHPFVADSYEAFLPTRVDYDRALKALQHDHASEIDGMTDGSVVLQPEAMVVFAFGVSLLAYCSEVLVWTKDWWEGSDWAQWYEILTDNWRCFGHYM